ncbi:uncharacterized protein Tco025E_10290 [Trypanosoma conorhini]|uniref:Uncharacterized protein n=1 Tax=Trypanosoma conorhini TaxID=83891 RepID=A0A3R7JPT9_9TRYP|nr:uncharacterized protein Tco025E_10290 [Trypanosoma conorhini]RNE94909.1 hypothetical protein Tco025E_10290 [Trypanosoma conorhini]
MQMQRCVSRALATRASLFTPITLMPCLRISFSLLSLALIMGTCRAFAQKPLAMGTNKHVNATLLSCAFHAPRRPGRFLCLFQALQPPALLRVPKRKHRRHALGCLQVWNGGLRRGPLFFGPPGGRYSQGGVGALANPPVPPPLPLQGVGPVSPVADSVRAEPAATPQLRQDWPHSRPQYPGAGVGEKICREWARSPARLALETRGRSVHRRPLAAPPEPPWCLGGFARVVDG